MMKPSDRFSCTGSKNDQSRLDEIRRQKEEIMRDMEAQADRKRKRNIQKERPIIKVVETVKEPAQTVRKISKLPPKSFKEIMEEAEEKKRTNKRTHESSPQISAKKQRFSEDGHSNLTLKPINSARKIPRTQSNVMLNPNHNMRQSESRDGNRVSSKLTNGSNNIDKHRQPSASDSFNKPYTPQPYLNAQKSKSLHSNIMTQNSVKTQSKGITVQNGSKQGRPDNLPSHNHNTSQKRNIPSSVASSNDTSNRTNLSNNNKSTFPQNNREKHVNSNGKRAHVREESSKNNSGITAQNGKRVATKESRGINSQNSDARQHLGKVPQSNVSIHGKNGSGTTAQNRGGLAAQNGRGIGAQIGRNVAAPNVRGIAAQNVRGIAAQNVRGIAAQNVRGIAAQNVRGIAAQNVRGIVAQNVRGIAAQNGRGIAAQNGRGIAAQNGRGIAVQSHDRSAASHYSSESEEYDSEMDDFIDDTERVVQPHIIAEIHKSLRFDSTKYAKVNIYDDCKNMESSSKEIQMEEAKSAKIAREEDMKEAKLEEERLKRKGKL